MAHRLNAFEVERDYPEEAVPVRKDVLAMQNWQASVMTVQEFKERLNRAERDVISLRENLQKAIAEEDELFRQLQDYRPEENRVNAKARGANY